MESKALNSVLRATEAMRNPADDMLVGDRRKKTEEGNGNKEVERNRNNDAISTKGATLELSKEGKKLGEYLDKGDASLSTGKILSDSGKTISGSVSIGCSEDKLKQLYANKEIELKRKYDAVSKNGDTLELSKKGKKLGVRSDKEDTALSTNKILSNSSKTILDSALAGCSEAKLRQLYANKEITKQQYERIMKKKKKK